MASPTFERPDSNFGGSVASMPLIPFEHLLSQDLDYAMTEGSLFLEGRGAVHETLARLTRRLDELGVPYVIAGGMALFIHGYRRFTEDIDLLVTRDGLQQIHQRLDGLGYVRPFDKSKNLRDAQSKVKIEFLLTGDYPGDGKPKPISFPDPEKVAETVRGFRVLNLEKLIELKLASGMSGAGRAKDLADVQELIKTLGLPRDFAAKLHADVQPKYLSLWDAAASQLYVIGLPRDASRPVDASLAEFLQNTTANRGEVEAMLAAGLVFDADFSRPEYSVLSTTDPALAEKYGMVPQQDFIYLS
jgi:hypothetical protein